MAQSPNQILASLPDKVFAATEPYLKVRELKFGEVLNETGSTTRHVHFPHSGIISLVVQMSAGGMIETAMVGREGAWNAAAALDGKMSINKGVVQMSGTVSVIAVDALRLITDEYKPFRSLLMHHEQILFAEAQQSVACNAIHPVQPRMCRWLLRMRDLADTDDLTLTQDFLAQMLGVQRTSVTLTALALAMSRAVLKFAQQACSVSEPMRPWRAVQGLG